MTGERWDIAWIGVGRASRADIAKGTNKYMGKVG